MSAPAPRALPIPRATGLEAPAGQFPLSYRMTGTLHAELISTLHMVPKKLCEGRETGNAQSSAAMAQLLPLQLLCNIHALKAVHGHRQGLSAPKLCEHHGQAHRQVFRRSVFTARQAQGFSLQPLLKKPAMPQFSNALTTVMASPG